MSELEPVDMHQCKVYKQNGESAFTLGGSHKMVRCKNTPSVTITEKVPVEDGQIGSMSVCVECLCVATKQLNMADYEVVPAKVKP